jgi:glutathione S-transferase
MQYLKPQDAKHLTGVRVVLTQEAFGPWGQAVKKMLEYKQIPYVAVAQRAGEPNPELVEWTGTRNAPTIVVDDEPPVTRWLDQISYIDNMKPTPLLIPLDSESRLEIFGIIHELAGEWGLGWCRRLMMMGDIERGVKAAGKPLPAMISNLMGEYGFSAQNVQNAPRRVADIIATLARRLKQQHARGSRFLVGSNLTAADIYWVCFSYLIGLLPDDICAMTADMRQLRECRDPAILAAKDPVLFEHRDEVARKYLSGKFDF